MKNLIVVLLFCLLMSCGSSREFVTNTERVVKYDGIVDVRSNGKYIDEATLRQLVLDESKQHYIIFSTDWCGGCVDLEKSLKSRGWEKKVNFINFEDKWVEDLARIMGIQAMPTMIVELPNNGGTLKFEGPGEIMLYLVNKF